MRWFRKKGEKKGEKSSCIPERSYTRRTAVREGQNGGGFPGGWFGLAQKPGGEMVTSRNKIKKNTEM